MPAVHRFDGRVALDGAVSYVILREPVLLAGLLLAPVLALLLVWLTRVRRKVVWFGGWTSLGWVLSLTLYPTGTGLAHPAIRECIRSLGRPLILGWGFETWANIGLFALLAGCWALATKRAWVGLIASVGLSAAIELVQSLGIGHSCSGQDWAANSLGACAGAGIAFCVGRVWRE